MAMMTVIMVRFKSTPSRICAPFFVTKFGVKANVDKVSYNGYHFSSLPPLANFGSMLCTIFFRNFTVESFKLHTLFSNQIQSLTDFILYIDLRCTNVLTQGEIFRSYFVNPQILHCINIICNRSFYQLHR